MKKLEKIKNFNEIYDLSRSIYNNKDTMEKDKYYNKNLKIIEKYRSLILKISNREGLLKENMMDFRHVLPPWYAYPVTNKAEVVQTEYYKVYINHMRSLSPTERNIYENMYVQPEDWK